MKFLIGLDNKKLESATEGNAEMKEQATQHTLPPQRRSREERDFLLLPAYILFLPSHLTSLVSQRTRELVPVSPCLYSFST